MAWATVARVEAITGTAVTAGQLSAAQEVIEVHVNRTEDADDGMLTKDLTWLEKAVAWQAVWQAAQPGYATTSAFASLTQDGLTVQTRSLADQTLAPLAQRALKNVSWMAARSVRAGIRDQRSRTGTDWDESFTSRDDDTGWTPI